MLLVAAIFALFTALGWLNPVTAIAFTFGAAANQIHGWAHRSTGLTRRIVRPLQYLGVLQSPAHHAVHHGPAPRRHYCLITNFVNPAVDGLELWRRAEAVLAWIGIVPKPFVAPNPAYMLV